MDFKDYYAVLGVAPDADEKTIKQTYRKLARQYHPDVNPGDAKAEERFKDIGEAYQTLSDQERRAAYDAMREQHQQWQHGGGASGFDWGEWDQPGQRTGSRTVSPEDVQDLFGGDGSFSDFFGSLFGPGAAGDGTSREPRSRRGGDLEADVEITLEEAWSGTTRAFQIGERRVEARVPAGARSGARIRLAGQGGPGVAGGPAGDLFMRVYVAPHPLFERDGDDLTSVADVDMFTAAVGGSVRVPLLHGSVNLKIPARTQAGKAFRLRGKGMPRIDQPGSYGDQYVHVRLVLPDTLSDAELDTLRALAIARQAELV